MSEAYLVPLVAAALVVVALVINHFVVRARHRSRHFKDWPR
jgi:hypothetical protein